MRCETFAIDIVPLTRLMGYDDREDDLPPTVYKNDRISNKRSMLRGTRVRG